MCVCVSVCVVCVSLRVCVCVCLCVRACAEEPAEANCRPLPCPFGGLRRGTGRSAAAAGEFFLFSFFVMICDVVLNVLSIISIFPFSIYCVITHMYTLFKVCVVRLTSYCLFVCLLACLFVCALVCLLACLLLSCSSFVFFSVSPLLFFLLLWYVCFRLSAPPL